jgi:hypothetical protein
VPRCHLLLGATGFVLAVAGTAARPADPAQDRPAQRSQAPAGEGVFCSMAILNTMTEVGKRCLPGEDAAFQTELARAVAQIDAYVLRNSALGADGIVRFKREQSYLGAPEASLCEGELPAVYRRFAESGAERLRAETRQLLARNGAPTWGDCF